MRTLILILCLSLFAPVAAFAQSAGGVDLILPPRLASPDAPFYRGATVKMDDKIMAIREVELPSGVLAEYHPELNAILVSNVVTASEGAKAQALMDVLSALDASSIATAAGSETE